MFVKFLENFPEFFRKFFQISSEFFCGLRRKPDENAIPGPQRANLKIGNRGTAVYHFCNLGEGQILIFRGEVKASPGSETTSYGKTGHGSLCPLFAKCSV